MDPETAALFAQGIGSLLDVGVGIYNGAENRKLQRQQLAQNKKQSRFSNLIALAQQGQALPVQANALQRMIALRNAGG